MSITPASRTCLIAWTATTLLMVTDCGKSDKTSPVAGTKPAMIDEDSAAAESVLASLGKPKLPTVPKVPFNNQPCQSLSAADLNGLGLGNDKAKPDRAPATLPVDNFCTYTSNSQDAQVSYMTEGDYRMNDDANRSTSRVAPSDLPGAFYDAQGGLWFAKDGYYVVIAGRNTYKEHVAHIVVGKL
jgi:hypothetical protein